MGMRLRSITILCCLILADCTNVAVVPINGDGDYRGSSTRFQALNRACPRPGLMSASVRGGVMYYRWTNQYITVSVLSNGQVSGSIPGVQLTGTHDGTTIQGDVSDGQ